MASTWPGKPFPLGPIWDGNGHELLALLRERRARRALPVRRRRPRDAHRGARAHRVQLALLPARRRARAALRLPRARTVRPGARACASTRQAAHRPVREGDRRADRLRRRERAAVRARRRRRRPLRSTTRTTSTRSRSASSSTRASTGRTTAGRSDPWSETVIYELHVKGFTKLNEARPRGPARHLRRARVRAGDRVPHVARRHRGRAAPDPPHRRRELPHREGALELLGLQLDRLLRAARALRGDRAPRRAGARVQGHGEGAAPRRDRGDPRRRLQPHGGGQPPRPDARRSAASTTRRTTGSSRDEPRFYMDYTGTGNSLNPVASERAAADHGLAALLRDAVPRRRLPLRPRLRARARVPRGRPPVGVLRHHPPGPDAVPGEADRRAVGRRRGRLPGRQLPGALDGVERHLPRRRARLLARRRRASATSRSASPARPTSTSATAAARPRRSTSSPRTTASRSPTSSRTTRSTTRRTSRTTATAPTTTAAGTAASRARRTIRPSTSCASASSGTSSRRSCSRRACRCSSAATRSAAPSSGNNNAYCQDNEISWLSTGMLGRRARRAARVRAAG